MVKEIRYGRKSGRNRYMEMLTVEQASKILQHLELYLSELYWRKTYVAEGVSSDDNSMWNLVMLIAAMLYPMHSTLQRAFAAGFCSSIKQHRV